MISIPKQLERLIERVADDLLNGPEPLVLRPDMVETLAKIAIAKGNFPEFFPLLAKDPNPAVRRAVAGNQKVDSVTLSVLEKDPEESVRLAASNALAIRQAKKEILDLK